MVKTRRKVGTEEEEHLSILKQLRESEDIPKDVRKKIETDDHTGAKIQRKMGGSEAKHLPVLIELKNSEQTTKSVRKKIEKDCPHSAVLGVACGGGVGGGRRVGVQDGEHDEIVRMVVNEGRVPQRVKQSLEEAEYELKAKSYNERRGRRGGIHCDSLGDI